MKTTKKGLFTPEELPYDTFEHTQRLIIKELHVWLTARCKSMDEGWESLKVIQRMGQFLIDYADRQTLAFALKRILDGIVMHGKPKEHKRKIEKGVELTFQEVEMHFDLFELVAYIRSMVLSALEGHREEQKWMHRDVAKMRLDMYNKELHKQVDEGNL